MTTSMNKAGEEIGGAFADGLTLARFALTPVIMFVIIKGGWPAIDMAVLASVLFAVAALTDIADDMIGGSAKSKSRRLGWFDDIADTLLITGTLAAMFWTIKSSGYMSWFFALPALMIIVRDAMVGLIKGGDYRKTGWPETRFGTLKTIISMLAICVLIANPWLSTWAGQIFGTTHGGMYAAPWVSHIGLGLLWIAAGLSMFTGAQLLSGRMMAANDV